MGPPLAVPSQFRLSPFSRQATQFQELSNPRPGIPFAWNAHNQARSIALRRALASKTSRKGETDSGLEMNDIITNRLGP